MESTRLTPRKKVVRVSVSWYPDTIKAVEDYMEKNEIKSFSHATENLIIKTLKK